MSVDKLDIRHEKLENAFRVPHSTWWVLAITLLGFTLRLYNLAGESLWYDELLQLDIAQDSLGNIFPRLRGHTAVPLDYVIAHFWILLGRGEGWVRLPAVMVGTVTLPVAYQLGRVLAGQATGLLFGSLLALAPFHIQYSREVRPYALVVFGVTLAAYGFWQLYQTGRWRYFIPLQVGVLAALLAHIFAAAIFFPLTLFLIIGAFFNRAGKVALKTFAALCLTLVLPVAVFMLMGWGDVLLYTTQSAGQALAGLDSAPVATITTLDAVPDPIQGPEMNRLFIQDKLLAPFAAGSSIGALLLFNGLAFTGWLFFIVTKQYRQARLLLLWIVLPPAIIVWFLIFRDTFFAPRYIISILPAYLILLAAGLIAWPYWLRRWPRLSWSVFLLLAGLVIAMLATGLNRYYTEPHKEDWRLASNFVAANAGPDDAVMAFHAEPAINWYLPEKWAAPNYYYDLESIKAVAAQSERSWVILSIFSADYDSQVRAWLSEQGAIRFVLDPVIHVYYLGPNAAPDQLLAEIQSFALPADHALYASLARENRRRPDVARQYYQLAIDHAPNNPTRAEYQAALEALPR